jgi:hypothetical protein
MYEMYLKKIILVAARGREEDRMEQKSRFDFSTAAFSTPQPLAEIVEQENNDQGFPLVSALLHLPSLPLSGLIYRAGYPKNFPRGVHSHPRSSSESIFAIRPAKWGFSGLLSRLQQLSFCNSQRWRDDGFICVDVPSKRDGGQPSRTGAFYEFQLGEGRRGTTSHCIAVTGPIVANRAALERARRGG